MTVNKDYLEVQKLSAELKSELARQHNWGQQEQHWQAMQRHWQEQQAFWRDHVKMTRARVFIGIATVAALFGGLVVKFMGI